VYRYRKSTRLEFWTISKGRALALWRGIPPCKEMVIGRLDQTPQAVAARIEWCREWGCTHVAIDTMGKGFSIAEAHLQFLSEVQHRVGRS
jgi:hypothetical protein